MSRLEEEHEEQAIFENEEELEEQAMLDNKESEKIL